MSTVEACGKDSCDNMAGMRDGMDLFLLTRNLELVRVLEPCNVRVKCMENNTLAHSVSMAQETRSKIHDIRDTKLRRARRRDSLLGGAMHRRKNSGIAFCGLINCWIVIHSCCLNHGNSGGAF